jgi:hypothetical protein
MVLRTRSGMGWNKTGRVVATKVYRSHSSKNFSINQTHRIETVEPMIGRRAAYQGQHPDRQNRRDGSTSVTANTPSRSINRLDVNHWVTSSINPSKPLKIPRNAAISSTSRLSSLTDSETETQWKTAAFGPAQRRKTSSTTYWRIGSLQTAAATGDFPHPLPGAWGSPGKACS